MKHQRAVHTSNRTRKRITGAGAHRKQQDRRALEDNTSRAEGSDDGNGADRDPMLRRRIGLAPKPRLYRAHARLLVGTVRITTARIGPVHVGTVHVGTVNVGPVHVGTVRITPVRICTVVMR
jgi:hypothetical protein